MIEQTATWQLDKNVRYRRLLDEAVVIHQEKAEALVLNDTAIAFLELCDGKLKTREIITELTKKYDVEDGILAKDLAPFIEELAAGGIIHRVSED